ncbi:MAG: hypothetical protein APR54_04605 [Candidatus Cloacimonas sp. SDB]|nr:MAG: hypothetical protein APR54_04605 [Candidatus Cloacimonas sp. SDB]
MKKTFILLFSLLIFSVLVAETISVNYNFDRPEIVNEGKYTYFIIDGCLNLAEEGEPIMPYYGVTLLLPQGEEVDQIEILSTESYYLDQEITIKPAAKPFPISQPVDPFYKVKPDERIYNSSEIYPAAIISNTSTHFLSGHSLLSFTICPVKFDPAAKRTELIENIELNIHTRNSSKAREAERFLKTNYLIADRLSRIVQNPEMISTYSYPQRNRDMEYDMLLISNNELLPQFSDYVQFKQSTGYSVATISTEEIYASYAGIDEAEMVRNCIIDYYDNYNIDYVILGGDTDAQSINNMVVPHRGFHVDDDPSLPSDMYFSNLDGNWNTDGDNSWGEANEMDLYAEVGIGRICVDTIDEVINATHKLQMYQDQPVIEDIEKSLMVGEELNDNPWTFGGDYKDQIVTGSSANGYVTEGLSSNFAVSTLYERDGNWTSYDLYSQFNSTGINLLNHLGHSNPTYNMKITNNDLTTTNFTNDGIDRGYVIGYSQGCYNGSFDNWHFSGYYTEDCFAEKFSALETGEVACIANSRYGWYQPGGTNSSSQYYDRQFFHAIFGENYTMIGDANRMSKEINVSIMQNNSNYRWVAYQTNLFGDPTMDIWTQQPEDMFASFPASVPIGSDQIMIIVDAPYARAALMQNGELIGRGVGDLAGNIFITTFEPIIAAEPITLSITAHNKNRYEEIIYVVSDQPFVIYNGYEINDSNGNNNSLAEYGEDISLNISFYNVGNQPATNVTSTLLCEDEYITLTDDVEDLGDIDANTILDLEDVFAFEINPIIPDQHTVNFTMENIADDGVLWTSYFSILLNAPVLNVTEMELEDDGDMDGFLDPGETALITIPVYNTGHADSPEIITSLSCSNEEITVMEVNNQFDFIEADSYEAATFIIIASEEITVGTPIILNFNVVCVDHEDYNVQNNFVHTVGLVSESFETGDFSAYNWQFEGNSNWTIDTDGYDGVFCARSGNIGSNQTTSLVLPLEILVTSDIRFWKKVSTEANYDYFTFYIDDILQNNWSGEVDWSEETYTIPSGHHVLKWEFAKDGYVDEGQDCAWLDFVIMPVISGLNPAALVLNQDGFSFELDQGESALQTLELSNYGEADLFYEIMVDYPLNRGFGGPDEFGHFWFDNFAPNGPEYNWVDISEDGIALEFVNNDIGTEPMPIGFTFEFYGEEYDEFIVNPNGWMGFGSDNTEWVNTGLPNPNAPAPAICGFWDDLRPYDGFGGGGDVYYHSNEERLVVWFDNVMHYSGNYDGIYDFEMIIYPDNSILLQYRTMIGDLDTATIGIQNADGTDGLQVVYDDDYIDDEMAIYFQYVDTWLVLSETAGSVTAGYSDQITMTVDTADMEPGNYNCNIVIMTNDPENQELSVPVDLIITSTESDENIIPAVTELVGNYPNPFNPETKINFNLAAEENVKITVFNIKGQKVITLVDELLPAGIHSAKWNGKDQNNRNVTSGVYFYTMETDKYKISRKMMLLK